MNDESTIELVRTVSWKDGERQTDYSMRGRGSLPPDALREFERYMTFLRSYYGIPEDQPVFPPLPKESAADQPTTKPRATGRNRADHPWRQS